MSGLEVLVVLASGDLSKLLLAPVGFEPQPPKVLDKNDNV